MGGSKKKSPSQQEKSQHKNKAIAIRILRARLLESKQQEPEEVPQLVRKSSKKEQPVQPQQPVPAWQQKPLEKEGCKLPL